MVRSAELSGRLEETLNYLADYLEKDNNLKTKLRNAMIYPAFIIVVFLAVMILVVTVVIPQLKGIFTESGSQLPFITRVLMSVGDFCSIGAWRLLFF